jgi:predicted RNA-binding protein with TRAM domain
MRRCASQSTLAWRAFALAGLALVLVAPITHAAGAKTRLVGLGTNGTQPAVGAFGPSVSADGRFVTFYSDSPLVPSDTNGKRDVFVRNVNKGKTRRVSVRSNGAEGNSDSTQPAISANGRYVAFQSTANNLVNVYTNTAVDIFVHDRKTNKTKRVNLRNNGTQGNGSSFAPVISANGRIVAFSSVAKNLVQGDKNHKSDIFFHDRKTGKTRHVSVRSNGNEGDGDSLVAAIAGFGRFIVFASMASNLVANDSNGSTDTFIHDRKKHKTRRVSVRKGGGQANFGGAVGSASADGRFVAFKSFSSNLVSGDSNSVDDVFVKDRKNGKVRRVSVANNGAQSNGSSTSEKFAMSADGRFVVFWSFATNLVPGDGNSAPDIFRRGPLR